MARWSLKEAHYLDVPGVEWEYKETNRETGRQARKVYEVPSYLDPRDASDWNYRVDEMIVVANKFDPLYPRDIIFRGPPTPNMEPLDDEAKAISAKESAKWIHPIESLNMTYSESRLSEFERAVAEITAKTLNAASPPSLSLAGVNPADFARLQEQVAALMDRNAKLEDEVAKAPKRRL